MKKLLLSLTFAAFAGAAVAQATMTDAPPDGGHPGPKEAPRPAPPVRESLPIGSDIPNPGAMMPNPKGEPVSLDRAKTEKGLLVMFSCNTCPYVVKAQEHTRDLMRWAKKLGVGMVILNSNEAQRNAEDAVDQMRIYADKQQYLVPYLIDEHSMMADLFGATRTPEVFLFNSEGKLVYKGALEDNPANPEKSQKLYAMEAMKNMVANKPIKPTETKSIGCGIKRMQM